MGNLSVLGTRLDPPISIDDPKFVYVSAAKTDLRVTFEREIARLNAQRSKTPAKTAEKQNVCEFRSTKKLMGDGTHD